MLPKFNTGDLVKVQHFANFKDNRWVITKVCPIELSDKETIYHYELIPSNGKCVTILSEEKAITEAK